ncbi:hypothetical protein LSH36_1139g00015 [Paralvinella palmiformis]|uniref:Uncharacterized protein n=1 Tax=Paralvinella palmiformis TaxID=53620 RepID=A0AAD9IV94_9ANNE|nr:hypothetical protein LSH36_1139g00015 [Paralvinella palmiformis]
MASCASCDIENIAECFLQWKEKFLLYGEFCAQLSFAQGLLDEICSKDEEIKNKVEECEMAANQRQYHLRDLLALPVQRIMKYKLFLKKLMKKTADDLPEKFQLQCALDEMKDVEDYVNQVKKDTEQLRLINAIQECMNKSAQISITMELGHIHFDSEVRIKQKNDWYSKTRHVFVFDNAIVIFKYKRAECLTYIKNLKLSEYEVQKLADVPKCWTQHEEQLLYPFELVKKTDLDGKQSASYYLMLKTDNLREKCIRAIETAQENICPKYAEDGGDYFMHTFDKGAVCDICKKLFKGVFYQGYFCDVMETAVHKECIQKAITSTADGACENNDLMSYPWFVGEMKHSIANKCLEDQKSGTYLIRTTSAGGYALSLTYKSGVTHLRIKQSSKNPFYLCDTNSFGTLAELVSYYQRHSFREEIPKLQTTLDYAYNDVVTMGRATYSFKAKKINQLSFEVGDNIEIIVKQSGKPGWFKGRKGSKFGYFPSSLVAEEER